LRPLSGNTIDGYLTHVITSYLEIGWLSRSSQFRTPRLAFLLAGYRLVDAQISPPRNRLRIPVTFVLIEECMLVIDAHFSASPSLRLALRAAFSLGYGLSLRPSEYLLTSRQVPLTHQLNSSRCHFWWQDSFFSVLDLPAVNSVSPTVFSAILPYSKNHQLGSGGTHSIGCAPPSSPLCLVVEILAYVRAYPPAANTPLLASHGSQLSYQHFRSVLLIVARKLGLPPTRLVPASLRSGGVNHLRHLPVSTRLAQGDWRSEAGLRFYLRSSVAHANCTREAMYDTSQAPMSETYYSIL